MEKIEKTASSGAIVSCKISVAVNLLESASPGNQQSHNQSSSAMVKF